MSEDTTLYDLVLLLSFESDDDARAKIVTDVESAIDAAGGSVSHKQEWGRRPTTYPIRHESEAEYHLLQLARHRCWSPCPTRCGSRMKCLGSGSSR